MAKKIGPDCVVCGICETQCPVGAIKFENDNFYINSFECTDCGSCEEVCLVGAILPEDAENPL
jgi:NAD-dependent dihydropyrimidine dehydrogenase PreA subunit